MFFDNSVKLFHPLVHTMTNELRLEKREWMEGSTWMIDILMFIKKAFHLKELFDVDKAHAANRDALTLFKTDYPAFVSKC